MQRIASLFRFPIKEDEDTRRSSKLSKPSSSSRNSKTSQPTMDADDQNPFEDSFVDHGERFAKQSHLDMLRRIMLDREGRSMLANLLLRFQSNYCLRVRFCHVAAKFDLDNDVATEEEEKEEEDDSMVHSRGKYIVTTFIQDGSMFQCEGVPSKLKRSLLKQVSDPTSTFPELGLVREQFLTELANEPEVQLAIARVYRNLIN
ncbi:hypothetical protein BASA81_002192 [Batrachochytrium salamandrivorans]|nr:hypothetical protein BASA81_002192 [Batrachochytrium salamandrivorans]